MRWNAGQATSVRHSAGEAVSRGPTTYVSSTGPSTAIDTGFTDTTWSSVLLAARTGTAQELYRATLDRHPRRANPGSLWGGATKAKPAC
ncbi:hypothetical protein Daura_13605 [Dactylosporangium aurantiacum]|uniref:Uncharacterized protein n=1 Tax=Dactylosporangium aurantiacum TaxID=35754 RepID=A0A9Q9IPU2_9ACTN|nr:hypothetical protein [Dactylosporangium aurantiacum]MDG6105552.1 hypothetical protein [Dactylosporangium aurantiacum]UWZ57105.1 hypothetical protein Daura_13605 [Dactylosporangium aurantiacum]